MKRAWSRLRRDSYISRPEPDNRPATQWRSLWVPPRGGELARPPFFVGSPPEAMPTRLSPRNPEGLCMAVDVACDLVSGFAHRFIRFKVRQLIGRHGFTRSDRDDLEQELRLAVWQRRSQFDPRVADWGCWLSTVVERHIATTRPRVLGRIGHAFERDPIGRNLDCRRQCWERFGCDDRETRRRRRPKCCRAPR